jgi:cation diffusion facilitator CzcD-associated flavoprotein CzcO
MSGQYADQTIVVGAGPAGLATAACLRRLGVSALIIEQAAQLGAAWRGHYERLHLHTNKGLSALPFLPFPRRCPRYPSRQEVIAYLERYARAFQLAPRLNEKVIAARRAARGWEVETSAGHYRAASLVIASGYNREPRIPAWPDESLYRGTVLHSSRYRSGAPFRDRDVLVVGFGNSAGEIALDLCAHGARTALAVRGTVNVLPRELLGIPIVALGLAERALPARLADLLNAGLLRAALGDLSRYGLRKGRRGPRAQIELEARIPLIDVGTIALIRCGAIAVYPGIARFTADGVVFADGRARRFDAVILGTGFRPRVDEFVVGATAVLDQYGTPTSSGRESALPGLYFCGFRVVPTGMLREIAREARQIGGAIAARGRGGAAPAG